MKEFCLSAYRLHLVIMGYSTGNALTVPQFVICASPCLVQGLAQSRPLDVPTCSPCLTAPSLSLCLVGAPLFLSHPHFYNADPVLAEAVLGLHPNPEEHSLFLDIHPVSPCMSACGGRGNFWLVHTWLPSPPGTKLFCGRGDGKPGLLWHC